MDSREAEPPQGQVERTLAVLALLAHHPGGLGLFDIADRLGIPRSATHRVLAILAAQGYARQGRAHGPYLLTTRIASLGATYLSRSGITDLAQPVLERLAAASGELVRLALVDGRSLAWVAKAQGSPPGLRYDPDMGRAAHLSCSASGVAWLSHLPDEAALALVAAQGFGARETYGPRAPVDEAGFLALLQQARRRGFSETVQTFSPGMAAMAAAVRHPARGEVLGTVSIAGPHLRLSVARMRTLGPALLAASGELALVMAGLPGRL